MTGFEPATLRLEVSRAIQLRHTDDIQICLDNCSYQNKMHEGGFEPPKRYALDLKSNPFDQTRVSMHEDCHSDNCEI